MTLPADRRAAMLDAAHWFDVASERGPHPVGDMIRELLTEVDAEHRATIAAEVAANRLWEAYNSFQHSELPSSEWRERDEIIGLVPSEERTDGR